MSSMTIQQAMELAVQHHRAGRLADAESLYRQILSVSPQQPEVLHLLGILAIQANKLPIAVELINRAIAINPKEPTYHANLGEALVRAGRLDEAIQSLRRSLELGPVYEAWNNLGNALSQQGKRQEAIEAFRSAIAMNPSLPEAHSNLGDSLKQMGQFEAAMESIDRAIATHPQFMAAHNNKGTCLRALGRYDEAILAYRRAISIAPALPILHYNLAVTLLLKGNLEQGFIEYEHRFGVPELSAPATRYKAPRWEGEEPGGRTILLHAEQGFGDTIQFARYASMVNQRGSRVVLAVQPELVSLLQSIEGVSDVVSLEAPPPTFDLHCPLMSLPRLFKTTLETIPSKPYLRVDDQRAEQWAGRVIRGGNTKNIALVWSGRSVFKDDAWRSLTLDALAPLAAIEGVRFYSLQKGEAASQLQSRPAGLKITNLANDLSDFADTAAALLQMDLAITTDTAVAHLAGAMGVPTWLLTTFSPDWRWLLDREDSPWYPSMKLFRQTAIGDWETPIGRVARQLSD